MKKKKVETKENHWILWLAIIILTLFIIYLNFPEREPQKEEVNPLIKIIEYEIDQATRYFEIKNITPVCLDWATYYNESFQKYEGLDVRWLRYVDICNNKTYCDNLHTYLVVNGWGMEILLDANRYSGLKVIDIK